MSIMVEINYQETLLRIEESNHKQLMSNMNNIQMTKKVDPEAKEEDMIKIMIY